MKVHPTEIGRAGEFRVVSELLLRGIRPLLSIVDDGVDIMLLDGTTIQVKTSMSKDFQGKTYSYGFGFMSMIVRKGRSSRPQKMIADYAICWCVPDDLFYIIPKDIIGSRTRVVVTPQTFLKGRPSRYEEYKEAWDLLK